MIAREFYLQEIQMIFQSHPICGMLGPRQCGKTTLATHFSTRYNTPVYHFDLEDPTDLAKLEHPKLALEPLQGLIIIDEIQRKPALFPYLRVLVDRYPEKRLLILGSASRELIQQSSESLAGRIAYIEITPFTLNEVSNAPRLWERGGFPPSFLAKTEEQSQRWRLNYIQNFLERDIAALGFDIAPQHMRRLWMMLAHYHGNLVNYAELSRSLQLSEPTIRRYIDILAGTYMVRLLPAWHENISKRQIKTPKIYLRDSGLLHTLLGIDATQVRLHPKTGASWEGFAIEQTLHTLRATPESCFFWATQHQAELDLLIVPFGGKRQGFEMKYTDAPRVTRAMHSALQDLSLESLTIIIPGQEQFRLQERVHVIGLERLVQQYTL